MGLVVSGEDGDVFKIALNRPEKLNAVNIEMLGLLIEAFGRAGASQSKVVLLYGNGMAFCAGMDLSCLAEMKTEEEAGKGFDLFHKLNEGIWGSDKPVVAAINGYCLGGGNELAISCDFRIASRNAIFGQPEIVHGITPGGGATYMLPYLIGAGKAKEMIMRGNRIDSNEAHGIGLVNMVVGEENAYDSAYKYCTELAKMPDEALVLAKTAMNSQFVYDPSIERNAFVKSVMSNAAKERIAAFLSERD